MVIGQAGEFDDSGTQGCRALREEGYGVIGVSRVCAITMAKSGFGDRT